MKAVKIILLVLLAISYITPNTLALESGKEFISFGADLTKEQRDQIYQEFQAEGRPQIIEVTNTEEKQYLNKYISTEQIGSKAISSVYLRTLEANSGIEVETRNITWVTNGMYVNAVVTAGVKDVLIKASSPFPVSGTAALAGIIKSFETAQGQPIDTIQKDVAFQELVTTGKLGEDIGQENAELLVRDVKKEVVEKKTDDPQEIKVIIENIAKQYNISLSQEQIKQIQQLMVRMNSLDLNIKDINLQLQNLNAKVKSIQEEGKKARGLLEQILSLLQQLLNLIVSFFS